MSQRFALLVGNNEYADASLAKLVSPPHDINQLGELLRATEIGGFDSVDILVNQPFAAVRRSIASFFSQKKRDDLLLLYFSGHGILDDNGQLYLAVKDTERDLLSATAIEATFVTSIMDRSISRRQVLVLDCCHSGAFGRSKGVLGASVGTATTFEGKGYGRVVLTASDATQYAWDGEDLLGDAQTSMFTRYLVQGLRTGEADSDADGLVTLDELYDYVYENVIAETPRQTPAKWSYRQQGTIVLARNPRPVVKPAPLPPELVQAIESPFAGVRQGTVHDLQRLLQGSDRGLALSAQQALEKLVDDDSRIVSSAAQAALSVIESSKEQPPLAPPAPDIPAPGLTGTPSTAAAVQPTPTAADLQEARSSVSPAEAHPSPEPALAAAAGAAGISAPAAGSSTPAPIVIQPSPTPERAARPITRRAAAEVDYRPYLLVAAGVSLGEIGALLLALLINLMIGYFIGLALAGAATGYLLFRQSPRYRWGAAAVLAVSWSVPLYLSFFTATTFYILAAVCLANIITALAILLRPQILSNHSLARRVLLDQRRIGMALLAALTGTVVGHYLGAAPYSYNWETFVGALVSQYTPSDVVGSVYLAGYFSIALAAILGVIVLCAVLYLLERYFPAPSLAGAEAALSVSAAGSIPSTLEAAPEMKAGKTVPAAAGAMEKTSTRTAALPFIIVALGWSVTWVLSLALGQITNSGNALLMTWFAGGFLTGAILFRDMPSGRWLAAALVGACWLVPYLFIGSLVDISVNYGVFDSTEASSRFFVIVTSILVGYGSSMMIFHYLNQSKSRKES